MTAKLPDYLKQTLPSAPLSLTMNSIVTQTLYLINLQRLTTVNIIQAPHLKPSTFQSKSFSSNLIVTWNGNSCQAQIFLPAKSTIGFMIAHLACLFAMNDMLDKLSIFEHQGKEIVPGMFLFTLRYRVLLYSNRLLSPSPMLNVYGHV